MHLNEANERNYENNTINDDEFEMDHNDFKDEDIVKNLD